MSLVRFELPNCWQPAEFYSPLPTLQLPVPLHSVTSHSVNSTAICTIQVTRGYRRTSMKGKERKEGTKEKKGKEEGRKGKKETKRKERKKGQDRKGGKERRKGRRKGWAVA
ncbi:Nop56, partial [Ophiophagus hannah]